MKRKILMLMAGLCVVFGATGCSMEALEKIAKEDGLKDMPSQDEPAGMEEEAYAFLEKIFQAYKDGRADEYANQISQQVLEQCGLSSVTAASNMRQIAKNYNMRNMEIQTYTISNDKAIWGLLVSCSATYNGQDMYVEDELLAFKENGKWVWCADNDIRNYSKIVTEPATMEEVEEKQENQ